MKSILLLINLKLNEYVMVFLYRKYKIIIFLIYMHGFKTLSNKKTGGSI